jgi:hypothetical protein
MTRPEKRDDRSHGEEYPGPAAPDAEDESDRYGVKRTRPEKDDGERNPPGQQPARDSKP